uniref:G-patch domain and KOW motifs-containing protein-like n=1 Tax=Dermatophagoides pteronyssinus TaxID=6956 RepID=A0A6P6Y982_DERPT|nr:G-patch domain and KOW motifs-containing protein-like [Dermatophagoides pteronyssinus]
MMADEDKSGENDENKATTTPFKMTGFAFKKIAKPKTNLLTTKQIQNDLIDIVDHDNDEKGEIDFVTSIDDNQIQGTRIIESKKDEKSIIIPLIKVNKYRFENENRNNNTCDSAEASPQLPIKNEDDDDDLITKQAKQELIVESKMIDEDQLLPAWQSLLINKLPDEYENDSKCDVSMRPDEPKLNDYEQIPVNVYGAAMLRGMGWKEGAPIGGINKSITPIIEPQLRPRGLGLGADISIRKQLEQKNSNRTTTSQMKDEPILRKGCHVCIEFGPYKGYYGIVENLTGDESIYVQVRLTLTKDAIQILQDLLRIVTKQEYDSESKVINKYRYDEYKKKDSQQQQQHQSRSRSSSRSHSRERRRSSLKDERMDDDGDDGSGEIWIVPKIRVQIVDKKYKNGRYYKEKVVIMETRGNECICRTKDKKILNNVTQSMLRTVIPSLSDPSIQVMILRGRYQGKLAKIDTVDWKHEQAMINLTGYISKPFSIALDDITEFRNDDR